MSLNTAHLFEVACYVAAYPLDYDESTIEDMCTSIPPEAVIRFFEFYGRKFGIDTTKQQNWADAVRVRLLPDFKRGF